MAASASPVAIITGGTRGIGLATARTMGRDGWAVAITGTSDATLKAATDALGADGISHLALKFSVDDEAAWGPALKEVEAKLGTPGALVCNAGISPKRDGRKIPLEDMDMEVWHRTMRVNLDGVLLAMRAVLPGMIRNKGGAIVAVSSLVGRIALPLGSVYYTASKTAVLGLVRSAAVDLGGHNIRVNAILPGRIDTDMTREAGEAFNQSLIPSIALGRLGRPEEVADAIAYLCSPRASYITGVSLDVGGGWCIA